MGLCSVQRKAISLKGAPDQENAMSSVMPFKSDCTEDR